MTTADHDRDQSEKLTAYLAFLRRRKWSILIMAVLVGALATFVSIGQSPVYASEARVLVEAVTLVAGDPQSRLTPNLETERALVETNRVAEIVADDLGIQRDSDRLLRHVSADIQPETEILVITYESRDPEVAAQLAQAFADGYLQLRREQALQELLATAEVLTSELQRFNEKLAGINADLESLGDASPQ